jgi:hypothetical protein
VAWVGGIFIEWGFLTSRQRRKRIAEGEEEDFEFSPLLPLPLFLLCLL